MLKLTRSVNSVFPPGTGNGLSDAVRRLYYPVRYIFVSMKYLKILTILTASVCLLFVIWRQHSISDDHKQIQVLRTLTPVRTVPEVKVQKGDNSVKVLLLAYFRTGSTFTAELLHQTEGAFYAFEPLHTLYGYYKKKTIGPILLNGTKWTRILEGYELPYAAHLLDALVRCDINSTDRASLLAYAQKSKVLSKFRLCKERLRTSNQTLSQVCVPELKDACLKAPVRVIKSIRTPMRLVPELLNKNPSLKVIHLLRDPRGHIRSWLRHIGDRTATRDNVIESVCNRVQDDLEVRQKLEKQYPGSFMELIYEDLAQNPMDVLRKIYKWLHLPVHDNVKIWLTNSTQNAKDGSFVQTFRKNSSETAYTWRKGVSWKFVKAVNKRCQYIISHGHFPPLTSEMELKSFTVPKRRIP